MLSWQNGTKRGGQTSAVSEGAFIRDLFLAKPKVELVSHELSERCDSAAAQCKQTDRQFRYPLFDNLRNQYFLRYLVNSLEL